MARPTTPAPAMQTSNVSILSLSLYRTYIVLRLGKEAGKMSCHFTLVYMPKSKINSRHYQFFLFRNLMQPIILNVMIHQKDTSIVLN